MSWWEEIFGDEYVYALLEGGPSDKLADRQADFVADVLGLKAGTRILDVGCGTGWLSVRLAKKGALVTGIDSSPYMAEKCRLLSSEESGFSFLKTDFRKLSFAEEYDAAICWGNTLGYESRDADVSVLKNIIRTLVPGGTVLLDLHNSVFYRTHVPGKSWREKENEFLLSSTTYDEAERRLDSREVIIPKEEVAYKEYVYSMLHYEPEEIKGILESLHVADVSFYGDACAEETGSLFSKEGYTERSHIMIVSGVKKQD